MKEVPCFQAYNRGASRLGEAWPRPRLGRKTYWHKDSEAYGDSKLYNTIVESRRFEARRSLADATPRTQNVLAQGQSEAYGDSKLYNTIVEVPARLNLK